MVSTINIADAAAATASKTAAVALTASGKPKEKRRNNEKRKEKSRDAARCRRSRETEIFTQLAQVLPLKEEDVNQLDKASVMRIAIAYLKVREMLQLFPKIQELTGEIKIDTDEDDDSKAKTKTDINNFDLLNSAEASHLMKQTLDGFLIILSNDGDITYVSDNITDYLGIAKIDILGQQIWEYSHQCDHAELKEALNIKRNGLADKVKDEHLLEEGLSTDRRDLFVRLKCTLTSRGRSINIKSASYKVIHVTGHLVVNTKGDRVLVAIGRPIPHPSNIEIPLGTTTFLTKHSLDMKFTYVDDKMSSLFGYKPEDLLEKSLFDCHHGADSDSLMATFKTVLGKGQGETCRYRFLGKCGGYCWIVTQATILYDKMKPQSVVCVNYVISQLENDHEIYSLAQYEASQQQKLEDSSNNNTSTTITDCKESNTIASNSNNKKKLPIDNNQPEESAIASIATTATIINNKNNNNTINKININNNSNKFNISNNNKININNNNCNKTKKFNIIGEENGEVAAVKPSPTVAAAATIITTTQKTPSPVTPTTIADDDNNILPVVKREQTSPAASPPLKPIEIDIDVDNKSSPLTPIVKREGSAAHSQLPLCRSLQTSSSLGPSKAKLPALLPPPVAKPGNENRPKSVTASVFRVAPTALNHSHDNQSLQQQQQQHQPTTSGGQTIFLNPSQLPQLNAAPRAQSVTASVFTPISQLPNKQQQHIAKASTAAILGNHHQQQQQQSSSLLARAEDMNKGFLSFAEDATELRMLKEEPDDLAHLAPNTVDACIPLDDATPLFSEMLVGLMPYGSLLPDDINSLDSTTSSSTTTTATTTAASSSTVGCGRNQHGQNYSNDSHTNGRGGSLLSHSHSNNNNNNHNNHNNNSNHSNNNNGQITTSSLSSSSVSAASPAGSTGGEKEGLLPFINYREESNDTNCSQHLLSPSVTSKSPEASSLPSLCSPNSLSQEDEFAFMTMNVDDDIDLTMRAPYIPMNEQDDLPLLTDDLMWCGASAFPAEELNMHKDSDVLQYDVLKQQLQLQQQLQQQQQQQQQQLCGNRTLLSYQLHQQQQELSQQHFNNSLCSSPASTASSLSPSPVNHHHNHHQQQQQQQQQSGSVFTTDSSELAALLCGSGNGSLSILSNHGGSGSGCAEDSDSGIGIGGVNGAMSPGSSHHQQHSTSLDADDFRLHSLQQQLHEHHQHQQQQQQQHNQHQQQLLGLDIDCKKEKFESGTAGLCESIEDAFEHVYSKDSPNLDCWNELLQINVNDTSSSSAATTPPPTSLSPTSQQQQQQQSLEQQQQQQQDCKQHIQLQQLQSTNIILNATATAATLHVPLITIQTSKNLLLQQQQQQQQQQQPTLQRGNNNKLVLNDEMLSGRSIGGGNNNSKKLTTIKLVNASSVAPNAATTATATIRIADNRGSNSNNTTTSKAATKATAQQQQHGNKRHLSATSAASQQVDAKRLKNSNATTIELLTTPHLLQQLTSSSSSSSSASAATSASLQQAANNRAEQKQQQQQQQQQQRKVAAVGQRWASQQQQQQQQQSNSVLKNLLISGCDVSAGYCLVPMPRKKLAKA